jgi:hypothetical protein
MSVSCVTLLFPSEKDKNLFKARKILIAKLGKRLGILVVSD